MAEVDARLEELIEIWSHGLSLQLKVFVVRALHRLGSTGCPAPERDSGSVRDFRMPIAECRMPKIVPVCTSVFGIRHSA
jgi:hypothetical protein